MPIRAGQLDRRIIIQELVTEQIGGATVDKWQPVTDAWARRRDITGYERQSSQTETAFMDSIFTIRYVYGVKKAMRIVEQETGLYWDIVFVAEIGRKEGLDLTCQRVGG